MPFVTKSKRNEKVQLDNCAENIKIKIFIVFLPAA